jgi:heme oxygenase-like protein
MLSLLTENMITSAAALGRETMEQVDRAQYGRVLANLYEVVRWSVPLMQLARAATSNCLLQQFLDQHIKEETGHDEWLLEDLAAFSGAPRFADTDVPWSIEPPQAVDANLARAMIAHERLLEEGDVWPLIGHMWSLESRPPVANSLGELRERLRLTPDMTRTLDRHATADPHHARELRSLLCSLDEQIMARVNLGARITATAVVRMWLALRAFDGGRQAGVPL